MTEPIRLSAAELADRLRHALHEAGAASDSAAAATRAMMHASRIGVDSHGARLVGYYRAMLRDGRVNARPTVTVRRSGPATAMVDGDHGLGHLTSYRAMETAMALAAETGVGAVGAVRSSHFGAAGAYAVTAAEAGMIGVATSNSESLVALFGGTGAFHGTNPIAVAAPVVGSRPWLLDMATSSIPHNRVLLYRSLGLRLPLGVAADAAGEPTRDPSLVDMLLPLGGLEFGFKGAALAGVATLLSAVLTGARLDQDLAAREVAAPPIPPELGHFFLAVDPARFVGRSAFARVMDTYLGSLRAAPTAADGGLAMVPGDREWRVEAERERDGIPLDPVTAASLGLG